MLPTKFQPNWPSG